MLSHKGIQKIFSEIPKTYEITNHILTFGLDTRWRKKTAMLAARRDGTKWLDVCSGTGEMAAALRRRAPKDVSIVAADFCLSMLHGLLRKKEAREISLCAAEAGALPFSDGTFDVVTISFATRNINASRELLLERLSEFRRVIKPGGIFVNLETSQPICPLVKRLFHIYVRMVVMPLGYLISGSRAAYRYLAYTIPRFFRSEELSDLLYQAGFKEVIFFPMTFGLVAAHMARK